MDMSITKKSEEGSPCSEQKIEVSALQKRKRNRKKKLVPDQHSITDATNADKMSTLSTGGKSLDFGGSSSSPVIVPAVSINVVCGQNKASMNLSRLKTGSKIACIMYNDCWLTPNQFQHISGRGTARDWKRSIKHNGTSLKALLANKTLSFDIPSCTCTLCRSSTTNNTTTVSVMTTSDVANAGVTGSNAKEETLPLNAIDNQSLSSGVSVLKNFSNTGITTRVIDCSTGKTSPVIEEEEVEDDGSDEDTEIDSDTSVCEDTPDPVIKPLEILTEAPDDLVRKRELMQALSLVELEPKSDITTSSTPAINTDLLATSGGVSLSHKRKSSSSDDKKKKKLKKIRTSVRDLSKENKNEHTDLEAVSQNVIDFLEVKELSVLTGDSTDCQQKSLREVRKQTQAASLHALKVPGDISPSESGGSGTTNKEGTMDSDPLNRASQFSYRAGLRKEAAMTHIIHELRHYKKQLVEKIDATRCGVMLKCTGQDAALCSPTRPSTHSLTNINNNYTFNCQTTASMHHKIDCNINTISKRTPPRKTMENASCAPVRGDMSEMLSSDNDYSEDDNATSDSDSKELPDLVRSHNPSIPSSSLGGCSTVMSSSLIYSSIVNSPGAVVARLLPPRHPVWSPASSAICHQITPTPRHPHASPGVTHLSAGPTTLLPAAVSGRVDATQPSPTPLPRRCIVTVDESFAVFDEYGALDLSATGRARRLFGANMASSCSQIDGVTHRSAAITGEYLFEDVTDGDNVLDLSTRREDCCGGSSNERREVNNGSSRHHLAAARVTDRSSNKRAGKRRRHRDRSHKRNTLRPGRDQLGGSGGGAKQSGSGGGGVKQSESSINTTLRLSVNSFGEVQRWTTNEVVAFVSSVPGCQPYCETLERLGVTGSSLPLLTVDLMVNALHIQPIVAGSLRLAIDKLMTS